MLFNIIVVIVLNGSFSLLVKVVHLIIIVSTVLLTELVIFLVLVDIVIRKGLIHLVRLLTVFDTWFVIFKV